jgi:putative ABC transport system permease protein
MRQAFRALARRPAFALVAVGTLALGLGANAAIFSVIDAVLLRPLPYRNPDRLVMPWEYSVEIQRRLGFDRLPSSPGDVTDFRTRNRTFAALASMRADRINLTGDGAPERVGGVRVSEEFFDVLGVAPIRGRTFVPADQAAGRVALIGEGLWRRRFGGDPRIVGQVVSMNGEPATILGVLPSWFRFPAGGELPENFGFAATPDVWALDVLTPEQQRMRGGKSFAMIGRLDDGVTLADAEADLNAIAAAIAAEFPDYNAGWRVRVLPLREQLVGGLRRPLLILLTAVGFVLLIACANVANLLLVRAASRQRELCVRHALGAGRGRLVRELVLESLLLSLASAAVGLVFAWWGLRALLATIPSTLPSVATATLDLRVLTFMTAMSTATGIIFGLVPAIQGTRCNPSEGLRDGARGTVGSRRANATRNVLVVFEVALAAVLLIGAALLIQTFVRLVGVETGFRPEGVLTMELVLPRSAYPEAQASAFHDRLLARLSTLPGVEGAAATSGLPLSGRENLQQVTIEGRPRPRPGSEILTDYRVVTPGYFEVLGMRRLEGDGLREEEAPDTAPTLVINETMARAYWPGESPIGRRLKLTSYDRDAPWYTVVGVVNDTRYTALDSALRPQVYVHFHRDPAQQMWIVLRTGGDPLAFANAARNAVHEIDPNQPVGRVRAMAEVVAASVSDRRFSMFLLGMFATLALTLSVVGLYAVVSYSVSERIHEMGVRLALGAQPSNLLTMVLGEGLRLAAIGMAIGLGAALVMTRFLEALLFGVHARDAATFVAVPLVLTLAALFGCLVPAVRAMRIDPVVALRAE